MKEVDAVLAEAHSAMDGDPYAVLSAADLDLDSSAVGSPFDAPSAPPAPASAAAAPASAPTPAVEHLPAAQPQPKPKPHSSAASEQGQEMSNPITGANSSGEDADSELEASSLAARLRAATAIAAEAIAQGTANSAEDARHALATSKLQAHEIPKQFLHLQKPASAAAASASASASSAAQGKSEGKGKGKASAADAEAEEPSPAERSARAASAESEMWEVRAHKARARLDGYTAFPSALCFAARSLSHFPRPDSCTCAQAVPASIGCAVRFVQSHSGVLDRLCVWYVTRAMCMVLVVRCALTPSIVM